MIEVRKPTKPKEPVLLNFDDFAKIYARESYSIAVPFEIEIEDLISQLVEACPDSGSAILKDVHTNYYNYNKDDKMTFTIVATNPDDSIKCKYNKHTQDHQAKRAKYEQKMEEYEKELKVWKQQKINEIKGL